MRRHSATNSAAFGIARRHRGGQRMLRRERQERHAEQRVGTRGVDLDALEARLPAVQQESQARALAAADPLRLHQPHALGPAIQRIQRVQQFLRIVGDLQEPLAELLLLHQRAGPPAAAVDHLLVRQHGAVDRVPVDPALLALDQAGAQEIQEQLLLMAVIFRIAGGELALPLERQPHALQLGAHGGDVFAGPLRRMDAALARRVLGRQAERVPAHRMHHREAARPLVARHHVAQRVVAHMAHVDLPAGIREHLQHVVFRLVVGRHVRHPEAAALGPGALPARFGLAEIVARRLGRDGRGIGQAFGHRLFIDCSPRLYPSQPPPTQEAGELGSGPLAPLIRASLAPDELSSITYNPQIFDLPTIGDAMQIILTPGRFHHRTPLGDRNPLSGGSDLSFLQPYRQLPGARLRLRHRPAGEGADRPAWMQRGGPGHQPEHAGDVSGLCGLGPFLPAARRRCSICCLDRGLRFDLALSVWVRQHCSNVQEDIARIARALVSDGGLFVVNQRRRAVPTVELGWIDDGIDVYALLRETFRQRTRGSLPAEHTTRNVSRKSSWATYPARRP